MRDDDVLPLVRRWAVDWLASHDPGAARDVLAPDYRLRIGAFDLDGVDAYLDGTVGQLQRFPGLVLTVHEVLTDGTTAAVRFSEHGASTRHEGRVAAWTGVAIHRVEDGLLARSWAEEDYHARRRQLASGTPDAIAPPAIAPWDTAAGPSDTAVEDVVRGWLEAGLPGAPAVVRDDAGGEVVLHATSGEVDVVFSAGSGAAFHGRVSGVAADGTGRPATMDVAGIVSVRGDQVVAGTVVTDRLGALGALKPTG